MFIFTIGDRVLGVCDYDHLKENVEKIWHESCEDGTEKDVIVHEVNEMNKVVYESPYVTYYFDKYDEGSKLGLRLIGLGGSIDIPLEIKL